jgi:hypothetical protein
MLRHLRNRATRFGFIDDLIEGRFINAWQRNGAGQRYFGTISLPGIDESTFDEIINKAKAGCPVSQVLNAEITLDPHSAPEKPGNPLWLY